MANILNIPRYDIETGEYELVGLDLDNPKRRQFTPRDIAEGLAKLKRFSSHLPFSVLEHSINLSIVLKDEGYEKEALLHDLVEAAGLGDISTPIKDYLLSTETREKIDAYERRLLNLYGISYIPKIVKAADKAAQRAEFEFFLGVDKADQAGLDYIDKKFYRHYLDLLENTYYNRTSMLELKEYFVYKVEELCPAQS